MKYSAKIRVLRKEPLSPHTPSGVVQSDSRASASPPAKPASDKSAPSNQSAISRTGRGSASPFHISYFISHNFLRPLSGSSRAQSPTPRSGSTAASGGSVLSSGSAATLAEPSGRHFRGASAPTLAEHAARATLRSALRSVLPLCALALSACSATKAVESASGKNLNLDGYLMLGDVETASTETGTPTGKLIIGRVTYKSRKVAIPADQKVPTTGYYKATKTKSLFGTEEEIIEYDFTSESPDNLTPFLQSLKQGDPK